MPHGTIEEKQQKESEVKELKEKYEKDISSSVVCVSKSSN
jgi:hypothetical protein